LFGLDITIRPKSNPATIDAADNCNLPISGMTLAGGTSLGLGLVHFDADALATSANLTVMLAIDPAPSLSDPNGDPVLINTFTNGSIEIQSVASVPEPPGLVLITSGLAFGLLYSRRLLQPRTSPPNA